MELNAYLRDLERLVNTDSCSDDPDGLNRMAEFFAERFSEMGWNVDRHSLAPQSGTCVICTNRKAEHYDVMLVGHLDTVFPKGTCAQRPFRLEGNIAYGPGVCDMKQGCLLMYYLMKELPKAVFDKLNIVVVFNPDEEIGSRYSKDVYLPYAEKTDYAFLYEARTVKGTYCVERKGAVGFTVAFTGKAGHCGFVFENNARSAVSEMARWIVTLDQLQDRQRNTSVNVGVVSGGTKGNVVPEQAEMKVDIRFSIPEEADRVEETLALLMDQAERNGIGVRFVEKRIKLPLIPNEACRAYVEHITELGRAHGMEPKFKARGGLSDANIIAQSGPICLDGMGPAGAGGHSSDEYMLIDTVLSEFAFSNLLLKDLADRKR